MTRILLPLVLLAALPACGDDDDEAPIDAAVADATLPDAALPDALVADADLPDAPAPDAGGLPLAGFGDIVGMCDRLGEAELTGAGPGHLSLALDFAERYDDPRDRPLLTDGGETIVSAGNAGGSSLYSEVFAFEVLARCERAELLKTETVIVYDGEGKKTDLLVALDGHKIGVSVTRAVAFPFGSAYTLARATDLLDGKLDDIILSSAHVSEADRWDKQLLVVLAYDESHAALIEEAWAGLDAETRADTWVITIVTGGDDLFVYTDQ